MLQRYVENSPSLNRTALLLGYLPISSAGVKGTRTYSEALAVVDAAVQVHEVTSLQQALVGSGAGADRLRFGQGVDVRVKRLDQSVHHDGAADVRIGSCDRRPGIHGMLQGTLPLMMRPEMSSIK
jgi:hypothetical protein